MNPEETSQPRATAEEPLTPEPPAAAPESRPAEPLDDHTLTPPHGDALTGDGFSGAGEAAPAAPEAPAPAAMPPVAEEASDPAPVFAAEPPLLPAEPLLLPAELPEDHTGTPPHGDPLAAEPLPTFDTPAAAPAELPDDHTLTPPHGDLLPAEPAGTPLFAETVPESVTPPPFDAVPAPSVPDAPFARDGFAMEPAAEAAPAPETAGFAGEPEESTGGTATAAGVFPGATGHEQDRASEASLWGAAPGAEGVAPAYGAIPPASDELEATTGAEPSPEPEERVETGPNWMLAFICAWTGFTSLNEARVLLTPGGFRPELLHNYGFLGYVLLGLGLLFFALEALRWGKPGRGVGLLFLPSALTLAGVICLVLWNDPGRRI